MESTILFWLISAAFALCCGSFINVVVYRLPQRIISPDSTLNLLAPRSHCPCCKQCLKFYDLIPLLSWLLLKARCRFCASQIPMRYPLTESAALISGLMFSALIGHEVVTLLLACLFSWTLLALTLIDLDHNLLPDALTLPLLWGGLLAAAAEYLTINGAEAIYGAVAGWLLLAAAARAWRKLRGYDALGQGDVKMLAALGAWLGLNALPPLLMITSFSALMAIAIRWLFRRVAINEPLALGPWLALSGEMIFIWQRL